MGVGSCETHDSSLTPLLRIFLDRRRDLRSGDQIFTPALEVGIIVVDDDSVALAPGIEWNKCNVCQRVIADDVFAASHFFIQSLEMLFHLFFGLLWFFVVADIGSRRVDAAIEKVDPDACLRSKQRIARQQTDLGEFFVEIFVDDRRLVNDTGIVLQHRHFPVGISRQQILRFVLKINLDQLVGKFLFR
jgi:hypothetical protein